MQVYGHAVRGSVIPRFFCAMVCVLVLVGCGGNGGSSTDSSTPSVNSAGNESEREIFLRSLEFGDCRGRFSNAESGSLVDDASDFSPGDVLFDSPRFVITDGHYWQLNAPPGNYTMVLGSFGRSNQRKDITVEHLDSSGIVVNQLAQLVGEDTYQRQIHPVTIDSALTILRVSFGEVADFNYQLAFYPLNATIPTPALVACDARKFTSLGTTETISFDRFDDNEYLFIDLAAGEYSLRIDAMTAAGNPDSSDIQVSINTEAGDHRDELILTNVGGVGGFATADVTFRREQDAITMIRFSNVILEQTIDVTISPL